MKTLSQIILMLTLPLGASAANMGMIKIRAVPPPATILIDGVRTNDAREEWQIYELSAGSHQIEAHKNYYVPQKQIVTIRANEVAPALVFTFQQASGFQVDRPTESIAGQGRGDLTVITDIPGANVTLNGRPVMEDVTPLTIRQLGEGQWNVVASLLGKTTQTNIVIRPGELRTVRLFFDEANKLSYLAELARQDAMLQQQRLDAENLVAETRRREQRKAIENTLRQVESEPLPFEGTGRYPDFPIGRVWDRPCNTGHSSWSTTGWEKDCSSGPPLVFKDRQGVRHTLEFSGWVNGTHEVGFFASRYDYRVRYQLSLDGQVVSQEFSPDPDESQRAAWIFKDHVFGAFTVRPQGKRAKYGENWYTMEIVGFDVFQKMTPAERESMTRKLEKSGGI